MAEPPKLTGKSLKSLKIGERDSVIVIRQDCSVETYVSLKPGEDIERNTILAFGVHWSLESDDWKNKLMHRAAAKLRKLLNDE